MADEIRPVDGAKVDVYQVEERTKDGTRIVFAEAYSLTNGERGARLWRRDGGEVLTGEMSFTASGAPQFGPPQEPGDRAASWTPGLVRRLLTEVWTAGGYWLMGVAAPPREKPTKPVVKLPKRKRDR